MQEEGDDSKDSPSVVHGNLKVPGGLNERYTMQKVDEEEDEDDDESKSMAEKSLKAGGKITTEPK